MIDHLTLGWKVVRPDLRTRGGFQWPRPGNWVEANPRGGKFTVGGARQQFYGDGLSIARTWQGAASGGIPAQTALLLAYDEADVLGEDAHKLRVSRAFVVDVWDIPRMAREGTFRGADLRWACFTKLNLSQADFSRANCQAADFRGAYCWRANFREANLRRADCWRANFCGADLRGAFYEDAYFGGAKFDARTRFPYGFNPEEHGMVRA